MRYVLILFIFSYFRSSQQTVRGLMLDQSSSAPIPYVSIGIIGKPIGTLSDENGQFEFITPLNSLNDSIRFQAIGYKPITLLYSEFYKRTVKTIQLVSLPIELEEVVVKSKKVKFKKLGTTHYTKNNCTGFADVANNWKGSEAAILIKNNKDILIESFSFFVIQNKYPDSLLFRLMFYKKIKNNWVGPTFLKKPIVFKLGIKQGEFTLPLRDFNIKTSEDFFVSLECLMDEMEIARFCYSGSLNTPSYYKVKAFSKWHSTAGTGNGGGGADFNVMVSFTD